MTEQEVINLCNQTISEEFEMDISQLTPEARLREDLGFDSLDAVDMIVSLEQAFSHKLRDNERLGQIQTLSDLHQFVIKQVIKE